MSEATTRFQPIGKKADTRAGSTLLAIAGGTGVPLESICGGAGSCGKCRVRVVEGMDRLTAVTAAEAKVLTATEITSGMRLACQAEVVSEGDIVVTVPEGSLRGHHRLLASGAEPEVALKPALRKIVLRMPPATLMDIRADDDRLLDILNSEAAITASLSHGVHRNMPRALREKSWETTVTLFRGEELIRVDPGDTSGELLGAAADVGTTKIAVYLIDLTSGKTLAHLSEPNPQIPFGEDVMSRITYAASNADGLERLHGAVISTLNQMLRTLCEDASKDLNDVMEVMVVGNTAMHHIFFGIPPEHLAAAPYAPAVRAAISVDPAHIGMEIYPFGKVSSLPNIAGFVGADAVAVLLSSGLHADGGIGMMIDIGTNTEIIVGNKDRLLGCSCASGPAFEGAHIRHGMRASTGAIERVSIESDTLDVRLRTVDDAPPRGICGSGIVDAIAEMLRCGVISSSGKIASGSTSERIRTGEDGRPEFVLATMDDSGGDADVTVTQADVQEIQLAKSAIFTGVSVLVKRLGIDYSGIETIYTAGAFGTYIDASSAIAIGMYPDVPVERIRFIGNAAGSGARMALKSVEARDLADRLSKAVEYVELASEPGFQSEFAKAMFMPHREEDRFPSFRRTKAA
ncbi:MAG: DUF4445 domain-containing protein [Methanobacteriota archaeon]|nr:MAG: DUF4445 domain-containing protein [Euryarchaeota archaeon]